MSKKPDSNIKFLSKSLIRRTGKRAITDSLGTGLLGALAATLFSQAVKAVDKFEIHTDEDFGTTSIERKT